MTKLGKFSGFAAALLGSTILANAAAAQGTRYTIDFDFDDDGVAITSGTPITDQFAD